ncbi:MAG: enoyl-CoA hydratase family protein [Mycobacterium sp.]
MLVEYNLEGRVARLTLNSPDNHNALSTALVEQLHRGFAEAVTAGARAVVLGHTGKTFCAGADLSEVAGRDPGDIAVDRAGEMTRLLRAILEAPVPVIAAVDGHVRAGGMGLVGACDIAVAGPKSTFALTEARIGVAPSIISLTLLPKMTARAAGRYFLTGEKFGPSEAAEIGLITVATDDVEGTVSALGTEIAKASPQGLAVSKALTTAAILAGFDARADALTRQSAELFTSAEAREGMVAFLQKRSPDWV